MKMIVLLHYTTFPQKNQSELVPFPAFGVPADILLNSFQIFAVPYLTHKAAEHIRQELHNEVTAFYVMGAILAGIEATTSGTGAIFIACVSLNTFVKVLALPVITTHLAYTPYISYHSEEPTNEELYHT